VAGDVGEDGKMTKEKPGTGMDEKVVVPQETAIPTRGSWGGILVQQGLPNPKNGAVILVGKKDYDV